MTSPKRRAKLLVTLIVLTASAAVLWWSFRPTDLSEGSPVDYRAELGSNQEEVEDARRVESRREPVGIPTAQQQDWEVKVVVLGSGNVIAGVHAALEGEASIGESTREGLISVPRSSPLGGMLCLSKEGYFDRCVDLDELSRERTVVELCPTGRLTISVVDQAGHPVGSAFVPVRLVDGSDSLGLQEQLPAFVEPGFSEWYSTRGFPPPQGSFVEAGTDANGILQLHELPCGIELEVGVRGPLIASAQQVLIDPNQRDAKITFEVERGATVEGMVAHSDGSSLPHTLFVRLDPAFRTHAGPLIATVQPGGHYRFAGVPKGVARIRVLQGGASISHDVQAQHETVPTIEIPRSTTVAGRLRFAGGNGDEALLMEVYSSGAEIASAAVSKEGEFSLHAPPGDHLLLVKRYMSATTPLGLLQYEFTAPSQRLDIDLTPVLGVVQGRLPPPSSSSNQQQISATFYETGNPGRPRDEVFTAASAVSSSGEWVMGTIPPGTYDIDLRLGRRSVAVLVGVVVKASQTVDLGELTPVATARCAGVVRYNNGSPVEGREIVFTNRTQTKAFTTGSDGAFSLVLPIGIYTIELRANSAASPQGIGQLTLAKDISGLVLRCPEPGRILCSLSQEIAATGVLELRHPGDRPGGRQRSQRQIDGQYLVELPDLHPGTYTVIYKPDDGEHLRLMERVMLSEGETAHIALGSKLKRRQFLFTVDGETLRDIELVHSVSLPGTSTAAVADSATSDGTGVFSLSIPDGPAAFIALSPGFKYLSGSTTTGYLIGVGKVDDRKSPIVIRLATSRIALNVDPALTAYPPPRVSVTTLDGMPIAALLSSYPLVMEPLGGGRWTILSCAGEMQLTLSGMTAEGTVTQTVPVGSSDAITFPR